MLDNAKIFKNNTEKLNKVENKPKHRGKKAKKKMFMKFINQMRILFVINVPLFYFNLHLNFD